MSDHYDVGEMEQLDRAWRGGAQYDIGEPVSCPCGRKVLLVKAAKELHDNNQYDRALTRCICGRYHILERNLSMLVRFCGRAPLVYVGHEGDPTPLPTLDSP